MNYVFIEVKKKKKPLDLGDLSYDLNKEHVVCSMVKTEK